MISQSLFGLVATALQLPYSLRRSLAQRSRDPRPAFTAHGSMHIMVASKDVSRVRLALVGKPRTSILECTPLPKERYVQLNIQFPVGHSAGVIQSILSRTDRGVLVASSKSQQRNPCVHPVLGL